jgi:hypothetical protein
MTSRMSAKPVNGLQNKGDCRYATLPIPAVRCLETLRRFPDVPHAARRLHVSQQALRDAIALLQRHLGVDAIRIDGRAIVVQPTVFESLLSCGHPASGGRPDVFFIPAALKRSVCINTSLFPSTVAHFRLPTCSPP